MYRLIFLISNYLINRLMFMISRGLYTLEIMCTYVWDSNSWRWCHANLTCMKRPWSSLRSPYMGMLSYKQSRCYEFQLWNYLSKVSNPMPPWRGDVKGRGSDCLCGRWTTDICGLSSPGLASLHRGRYTAGIFVTSYGRYRRMQFSAILTDNTLG